MPDLTIAEMDAFQVTGDLERAIDGFQLDEVSYSAEPDPNDREGLIVTAVIGGESKRFLVAIQEI